MPVGHLSSRPRPLGAIGRVQCHRGANERCERLFINLVASHGNRWHACGIAFEAWNEEAPKGLPARRHLAKVIFHDILMRLHPCRSFQRVMPTGRPLLRPLRVFLHETSDRAEYLPANHSSSLSCRIDQLRRVLRFLPSSRSFSSSWLLMRSSWLLVLSSRFVVARPSPDGKQQLCVIRRSPA